MRLQSTVEGLSIAAISYYVIIRLLYGGKAVKAAGASINPEIAAGALLDDTADSPETARRALMQVRPAGHGLLPNR